MEKQPKCDATSSITRTWCPYKNKRSKGDEAENLDIGLVLQASITAPTQASDHMLRSYIATSHASPRNISHNE